MKTSPLKDEKDVDIVRCIEDAKEIRLAELARRVNMNYLTVRSRICDLSSAGVIQVKRGHNKVLIYPIATTSEV